MNGTVVISYDFQKTLRPGLCTQVFARGKRSDMVSARLCQVDGCELSFWLTRSYPY
jgi:hypothetical protein